MNGLRPREIVLRAARGDPTLLEDADVPWLCVTCNSCTEQCRPGIDVTELFYHLRENAAERGHIPAPYRAVAGAVNDTGLAFPNTKRTARMRQELGLDATDEAPGRGTDPDLVGGGALEPGATGVEQRDVGVGV